MFYFQPGWGLFLFRLLLANSAMAALLLIGAGDWRIWLDWQMLHKVAQLGALVVGSVLVYIIVLYASGMRWKHVHR